MDSNNFKILVRKYSHLFPTDKDLESEAEKFYSYNNGIPTIRIELFKSWLKIKPWENERDIAYQRKNKDKMSEVYSSLQGVTIEPKNRLDEFFSS